MFYVCLNIIEVFSKILIVLIQFCHHRQFFHITIFSLREIQGIEIILGWMFFTRPWPYNCEYGANWWYIMSPMASVVWKANSANPSRAPGFTFTFLSRQYCSSFLFSVFCFCYLFVFFFLSCVPKVAMSLDCLFIIVTSIFSNVDLLKLMIWVIFERSTICHLLYPLIGNIWWSPLQDIFLT